jgi:hypothetical protein
MGSVPTPGADAFFVELGVFVFVLCIYSDL